MFSGGHIHRPNVVLVIACFHARPLALTISDALAGSNSNNNHESGYVNSIYFTSWSVNVPLYVASTSNDQYVGPSVGVISRLRISLWAIFSYVLYLFANPSVDNILYVGKLQLPLFSFRLLTTLQDNHSTSGQISKCLTTVYFNLSSTSTRS